MVGAGSASCCGSWHFVEYINVNGERIFGCSLPLCVSEERRLIAMFWAWPPYLRASARSVDGFRLKHGNI